LASETTFLHLDPAWRRPVVTHSSGEDSLLLDYFSLRDKTAIITGSGRGIGEAIAVTYAEMGANIVLCARTQAPLDRVAGRVRELGRRALVVTADINDSEALSTVIERTANEFGRIDVVVNNAGGGGHPHAFLTATEQGLETTFHNNVTSRFQLSQLAVPHMLEGGGGSIVNITSVLGRVRDRGWLVSSTTNAAVAHMTRLMAADLSPRIRVNAIACGSVATPGLDTVLKDETIKGALERATLMGRLGQPIDIALFALYLASPASAWVTGKVFEIDGGQEQCSLSLGLPDL
jgi:7-alpha-hydroxysteroid dehydrogenase